jgi:hypothetical protein
MMMNPLLDKKSDTLWNMHDLINDLIDELRMTRGNFVSEIAHGLNDRDKSSHILNVLEYYDTLVLEELQSYMKKYSKSLFEIIQKRRMAYVEKVRMAYVEKVRSRHNLVSGGGKRSVYRYDADGELRVDYVDDNTIDLSRDQDDTANLVCGMQVISRGVEKIERIIQKKDYLLQQEKKEEHLRWWGMFSTFATVFVLAYIVLSTFYKI